MEQLNILYEDNHIVAVNKQCGELVQGDITGDRPLNEIIKEYIKRKYNKSGAVYLGIPHRIDRPVSGVILFSRTSKALTRINKMFQQQEKEIKKKYWAIVKECPPTEEDTITHYILRNSSKNKSYAYPTPKKKTKKATLKYKLIGTSHNYYFLEIELFTGRHHQIRCQLAKIGCPIMGDLKYGFPRSNKGGGIGLHARSLSFIHPVKKEPLVIIAPPPKGVLWDEFVRII